MRRALILLIAAFAAGCLNEGLTGSSTVNGAYALRTVNGTPLPYATGGSGSDKTEIIDDVITLYQGGTYAESAHSRTTLNGQVNTETTADSGSYALFGTSFTLTSGANGQQRRGLMEGNSMTIVENGRTSMYRK